MTFSDPQKLADGPHSILRDGVHEMALAVDLY